MNEHLTGSKHKHVRPTSTFLPLIISEQPSARRLDRTPVATVILQLPFFAITSVALK